MKKKDALIVAYDAQNDEAITLAEVLRRISKGGNAMLYFFEGYTEEAARTVLIDLIDACERYTQFRTTQRNKNRYAGLKTRAEEWLYYLEEKYSVQSIREIMKKQLRKE